MGLVLCTTALVVIGQWQTLAFIFLSSNAWVSSSAVVAVVALIVSIAVYRKTSELSRKIADRTVTIEAQKLLLEINKVLVGDPRLFALYKQKDEIHISIGEIGKELNSADNAELRKEIGVSQFDSSFAGKLAALGFMLLNVFEIVFAQMPKDVAEYQTWKNYFEDTLDRCPMFRKLLELKEAKTIYHKDLMKAFEDWQKKEENSPLETNGGAPSRASA